jgi:hypothetical protein
MAALLSCEIKSITKRVDFYAFSIIQIIIEEAFCAISERVPQSTRLLLNLAPSLLWRYLKLLPAGHTHTITRVL